MLPSHAHIQVSHQIFAQKSADAAVLMARKLYLCWISHQAAPQGALQENKIFNSKNWKHKGKNKNMKTYNFCTMNPLIALPKPEYVEDSYNRGCEHVSLKSLFSDAVDRGDRTGDHQTGGERGSGLLGEAAAASLRAAAGGPGQQTGERQEEPQASQLQRRRAGGPR